jgi:hypothetical protein
VEIKVIIKGINILSLDSLFSVIPTKYPIKKYKNPFIPITGLNMISCSRPAIKPTILPALFPLSNAITTMITRPVFGTTLNILKYWSIVDWSMKLIMIIKNVININNLNPSILIRYDKNLI